MRKHVVEPASCTGVVLITATYACMGVGGVGWGGGGGGGVRECVWPGPCMWALHYVQPFATAHIYLF